MPVTTRASGDDSDEFAAAFGRTENPNEVLQHRSQHDSGELSEDNNNDPDSPHVVAAHQQAEWQNIHGAAFVRISRPSEIVAAQQRGQFVQALKAQLDHNGENLDPIKEVEEVHYYGKLSDDDDDSSAKESLMDEDEFFESLFEEQARLDLHFQLDNEAFTAAARAEELKMQAEETFFGSEGDDRELQWIEHLEEAERLLLQNAIPVNAMRQGLVGTGCGNSYRDDNWRFINWCITYKPMWVTIYGKEKVTSIQEESEGYRTRRQKKIINNRFGNLLLEASEMPLMHLDLITPGEFMEYIDQLRHYHTKKRLSKSAYGNKRSALNDLFRWHHTNNRSFSPAFASELRDLYKGFFRILTQQGREDVAIGAEHGRNVKQGKDAMNVELYQALCIWFLDLGTDEGIFAHCFLVLTWNLMCRANSTSKVCFNHIFGLLRTA